MEAWITRLEGRFGRYAIPGLVRILVMLNALVYVLLLYNPEFRAMLVFQVDAIRNGQIWRCVTFLFVPLHMHPLFLLIALYFLWIIGEGLEEAWGAFRLNLFYLVGVFATIAVAFLFGIGASNYYLNTMLFLAFATLYPDFTVLLFFILPVAVKWLAIVAVAFLTIDFINGGVGARGAILAATLSYLLFFGPFFLQRWKDRVEIAVRRARFEDRFDDGEDLHRCIVCNATDITHPERDFRVTKEGVEMCEECLKKSDVEPGEVQQSS
ncbi:MAG: rhomboid family intramembrane serine protease [Verrucomicrobiia bacterium]